MDRAAAGRGSGGAAAVAPPTSRLPHLPPLPSLVPLQYFRDKILSNMEDPAERDRKWEEHLRGVQAAAAAA